MRLTYAARRAQYTRRSAFGLGLGMLGGCASSGARLAEEAYPESYAVPNSTISRFTSQINNVDYAIYLRAPLVSTPEALPLVVTLDADYQFAIAANHLEHLTDRGQIPPVVLASIGYAGQYPSRSLYQINRTRDYTPAYWPEGHYSPEAQEVSGGGPAFARVIAEEIVPMIASQHQVSSTNRLIVGHSYGGMFGSWLLCTRPAIFDRYLLISPSLWYAQGLVLKLAREAHTPVSRPTRLFVGVGAEEEQPGNNRPMVSDARRFAEHMASRDDPQLDCAFRVFEGENHASIFPAAFSTGIRRLFS